MTPYHFQPELYSMTEQLTRRYELFQVMRDSHLRWIKTTDDPQIKEIHRTIAALFVSLLEQYNALLDAIQSHR